MASADEEAAVGLLSEALHLRMLGECAPGGNETWHDWDAKAESFLRARTDRLGEKQLSGAVSKISQLADELCRGQALGYAADCGQRLARAVNALDDLLPRGLYDTLRAGLAALAGKP